MELNKNAKDETPHSGCDVRLVWEVVLSVLVIAGFVMGVIAISRDCATGPAGPTGPAGMFLPGVPMADTGGFM
jgi:hypothetical protein